MKTLIKNAYLISMDKNAPVKENACIEITDDTITDIGFELNNDYDRVIDAHGNIAMPGLINAHTHIAMTIFRGMADDIELHSWLKEYIFPLEAKLDSHIAYVSSLLGINEMLRRGITSFADMYFFCDDIARASEQAGIRADIGRCIIGGEKDAQERIDDLMLLYDKYKSNDLITFRSAPHAIYTCTEQTLLKSAEAAERLGTGLHIHVSETKKEYDDCMSAKKITPVEYLDRLGLINNKTLMAHAVMLSDNDIRIIADRDAVTVHNPTSNLKLGSGISPIDKLSKAGAAIALGSDGAASNNSQNIFKELNLAALLQKGLNRNAELINAYQALEMATVNGARAMNRSDIGMIKTGNKADIIIIDINKEHMQPCSDHISNLVYAATGEEVIMTMVNGEVLYYDGNVRNIDEEALYKEAKAIARTLKA